MLPGFAVQGVRPWGRRTPGALQLHEAALCALTGCSPLGSELAAVQLAQSKGRKGSQYFF